MIPIEFSHMFDRLETEKTLNGMGDVDSPMFRIGEYLKHTSMWQRDKNHIVDVLHNAEQDGFFDSTDGLTIDMLMQTVMSLINNDADKHADDITKLISRQFTDEMKKKVMLKWYKMASQALDRIRQLTSQFTVETNPVPSEKGKVIRIERTTEGVLDWNERHLLSNKKLAPISKYTVTQTFKSEDKLSSEILLVDVSGSMDIDNRIMMALLYVFNRIQHVRQGELRLQIATFEDDIERLHIFDDNGEPVYIMDENTSEEDLQKFEEMVYDKIYPRNRTDLAKALKFLQDNEIQFPNDGKLKKKTVITIITDDGSATGDFVPKPNTVFNVMLGANNYNLVKFSKQTKGYTNSLNQMFDDIGIRT